MPQNGTIDLTGGLVPTTAPPPPSAPIDLSSGFVEKPSTPPAPFRPTRPDQIPGLTPTVKTGQGPMPGAPVPQTTDEQRANAVKNLKPPPSITDHLADLSATLRARAQEHENDFLHRAATGGPPATYWEKRAVDNLYQGSELAHIASGVMSPTGAGLAAAQEIPVIGPFLAGGAGAIMSLKGLFTPRQADPTKPGYETSADALQRHLEAGSGLALSAAGMGKGVSEAGPAVRGVTRNLVGRSPGEIAEAEAKAGQQASDVQASNEQATATAALKNQTDVSKAQANFNEATAEHAGQGAEAQQEYQQKRAQWEQDNAEGTQKVQEQRAAEDAKQQTRQRIESEAETHATNAGPRIDETLKKREQAVKGLYAEAEAKIDGEGDAADIAERMQGAASDAMKESGPVPSVIQRMISRFTPAESAEPEQTSGGINLGDASSEMLEQMVEQGIFLPDEEAALTGEGATAAKPTFANLHSMYSALGKLAAATADRYQRAAYLGAQNVIRGSMKGLSDAAGATEQFNKAQNAYSEMARTFYNRSSPIAQALMKYREVMGALKDNPKAQSIAGSFVRSKLLSGGRFNYARELLGQFEGSPVDELDAMKSAHDQARGMPAKAKVIPDYVPKPEPQPGEVGPAPVHEQPVPAHTATLEPPPEPFNRAEFIKKGMTEKGRQMQHLSPFEVSAPVFGMLGAGAELSRGEPLAAAGTAAAGLAIPAARYGVGSLLQHPGFQDWVAKEPGAPLGQPGTAGARGNPTPFGSQPTGPTTPPGAGPSTPPAPFGERRIQEGAPPAGVPERRVNSITNAHNAGVMDALKKFGISHQPLDAEMGVEWQMILEDMRAAGKSSMTRAQRGLAQDAMNSWNRGTFTAEETANRIRSALGLGSGAK